MLRSLKLIEKAPTGQSISAAHNLKKCYEYINYKLSPISYNWEGCLCLYCHQGSEIWNFPNAQCAPIFDLFTTIACFFS